MTTFNVKSISGNNIVMGDNNNISHTSGNDDSLIRDEANSFCDDTVENSQIISDNHRKFAEALKSELRNYYSVESKMIFLNEVQKRVNKEIVKLSGVRHHESEKINAQKMLFFLNQEIDELPKIVKQSPKQESYKKTKVFISYSHLDKSFLDDLKRHFRPLTDIVDFWDDSKIKTGQKWKQEIELAIEEARVNLLLVSADFYNSDFIIDNELPPLLKRAEQEGATMMIVVLKPCLFEEFKEINVYQTINAPSKPVSSMSENEREILWVEVVRQIKQLISS